MSHDVLTKIEFNSFLPRMESGELGVFCAGRFQHAFEQMKFGSARRAEIV